MSDYLPAFELPKGHLLLDLLEVPPRPLRELPRSLVVVVSFCPKLKLGVETACALFAALGLDLKILAACCAGSVLPLIPTD